MTYFQYLYNLNIKYGLRNILIFLKGNEKNDVLISIIINLVNMVLKKKGRFKLYKYLLMKNIPTANVPDHTMRYIGCRSAKSI